MAASVIVDSSFLVTLLNRSEANHVWADNQALLTPSPWQTCDAVLSEAFHLLGAQAGAGLRALLRRGAVLSAFSLDENPEAVLRLMEKYADVPMSFADACLVRMTETLRDPLLLTTDADFRIYRRNGRHVVPCAMPE